MKLMPCIQTAACVLVSNFWIGAGHGQVTCEGEWRVAIEDPIGNCAPGVSHRAVVSNGTIRESPPVQSTTFVARSEIVETSHSLSLAMGGSLKAAAK